MMTQFYFCVDYAFKMHLSTFLHPKNNRLI